MCLKECSKISFPETNDRNKVSAVQTCQGHVKKSKVNQLESLKASLDKVLCLKKAICLKLKTKNISQF